MLAWIQLLILALAVALIAYYSRKLTRCREVRREEIVKLMEALSLATPDSRTREMCKRIKDLENHSHYQDRQILQCLRVIESIVQRLD